jgi:hypothetical protein
MRISNEAQAVDHGRHASATHRKIRVGTVLAAFMMVSALARPTEAATKTACANTKGGYLCVKASTGALVFRNGAWRVPVYAVTSTVTQGWCGIYGNYHFQDMIGPQAVFGTWQPYWYVNSWGWTHYSDAWTCFDTANYWPVTTSFTGYPSGSPPVPRYFGLTDKACVTLWNRHSSTNYSADGNVCVQLY